jgi:hypothetical protein
MIDGELNAGWATGVTRPGDGVRARFPAGRGLHGSMVVDQCAVHHGGDHKDRV